jgi:hypothetical protein
MKHDVEAQNVVMVLVCSPTPDELTSVVALSEARRIWIALVPSFALL